MKFTNGFWLMRKGVKPNYAVEYAGYDISGAEVIVYASTCHISDRGDTLNRAVLTITFSSPALGVIATELSHHHGAVKVKPEIPKQIDNSRLLSVTEEDERLVISGGSNEQGSEITVIVDKRPNSWCVSYLDSDGRLLTDAGYRNMAYMDVMGKGHTVVELLLSVGESVYGLGERFTPFVKNGQVVEMWNEDGGTSSEIAYKNVPFYISNRGYGVLVDSYADVVFEIASEKVSRVGVSLETERLRYLIFVGPAPRDVLSRYTELTGRPALVPQWTFGLWLTTSFTTNYDEGTVNSFINGMKDREIPLHVFHFDSFWMKQYSWCDFTWDPEVFPDPGAMLKRLKNRGLKICAWINPYIAQKSVLFKEAMDAGYLLKRRDGSVWQTDLWQAGMAVVDFTNPDAKRWYQDKLAAIVSMGVDCFKADFGERIPVSEIAWHDGADPVCMHNAYAYLFNEAVFEVLVNAFGQGQACLFSRSACAGGQQFPVHWGGDCCASYVSMAESLRGGLSLSLCGFGFWSHDIGGFEQTATADLYKRWCAFGLLSTHSRLHGSTSYRVPWLFDEEACGVLKHFVELKCSLMPYIYGQSVVAHMTGVPVMRPMFVEFSEDPACHPLDTQYMLGESLLVAPVFSEDGKVCYYLPQGRWTNYLTNEVVIGGSFRTETHDYFSLPLMVRPNTVLISGARKDRPDYDYTDNMTVRLYQLADGCVHTVCIPDESGAAAEQIVVKKSGKTINVSVEKKTAAWNIFMPEALKAVNISGGKLSRDGMTIVCNADSVTIELMD